MKTLLLNATCVAEATGNYTFLNPATNNLTLCTIFGDIPKKEEYLDAYFIANIILIFVSTIVLSLHFFHKGMIKRWRRIPSYELHQKLEKSYGRVLRGKKGREFRKQVDEMNGRYVSVRESTDVAAQRRTITIVEDLSKEPESKQDEITRKKNGGKKKKRSAAITQEGQGTELPTWRSDVVETTWPTSATVFAEQPATSNSALRVAQSETDTADSETVSPSPVYTPHTFQSYV
jgi:hypothetical protein